MKNYEKQPECSEYPERKERQKQPDRYSIPLPILATATLSGLAVGCAFPLSSLAGPKSTTPQANSKFAETPTPAASNSHSDSDPLPETGKGGTLKKGGMLKKAAQLVKRDHVSAAKPILLRILKRDPDNVQALRLLAECHINENLEGSGHNRARNLLNKAIKIDPDNSDCYRLLADLELIDGHFKKAIALCDKALSCSKPGRLAHRTRAIALSNEKRHQEAVTEMETFIRQSPKYTPHTAELYAGILEEAGRHKEAAVVYEKVLAEKFSDRNALKLAQCYKRLGKPQEALQTLTALIKFNSLDEQAFSERARLLVSLGKPAEALKDYNKSIELSPLTKTYLERAAVYERLGMKDKAESDRKKAAAF